MEVVIGKKAGFCAGVGNAVTKALEETKKRGYNEIYCLGEIVHNKQVVEKLKNNGLNFIENIEEIKNKKGAKVIFRAHGIEKSIYEYAKNNEMQIMDLTCANVKLIHNMGEEYSNKGYQILLVGEKNHPETIATKSFCGTNCYGIEDKADLINTINKINNENKKIKEAKDMVDKVLVLVQTTFNLEVFKEFITYINENLKCEVVIKNTICNATRLRQEETVKIAKQVEYMVIIGGKNSANTNKLYDISKEICKNAIKIETKNDLTKDILDKIKSYDKIGIMAGASTPDESINEVKKIIEEY